MRAARSRILKRLALVATVAVAVPLTVAVPAQAAPLTVSQYEEAIAKLVNDARADAGLKRLTVSVTVSKVARSWSETMARKATFKHNPKYSKQYPSGWRSAAENVAYGCTGSGQYSATSIHKGFMKSAGHKANILGKDHTHLGVGVAFVTRKGCNYVYVTENFASYPSSKDPDAALVRAAASAPRPVLSYKDVIASPDFTDDRVGDAFTIDRKGRLFLHPGTGKRTLGSPVAFGTGWSAMSIYSPGDWDGDSFGDLLARDTKGRLFLYPGDGWDGFDSRRQVGKGWTGYRIVPAGDINGDKKSDVLAIDGSGRLWLYPGDGRGGWLARKKVGHGWTGYDLYAAGDMNRDGRNDILSIDKKGRLYFYAGRSGARWAPRVQVGHGWNGYLLASGGDFDGDGLTDILGRSSKGDLYFYKGLKGAGFGSKTLISRKF